RQEALHEIELSLTRSRAVRYEDELRKAPEEVAELVDGFGRMGSLLYRRPFFNDDDRLFFDLVSYAPGMNTSGADVLAVLEAEAPPDAASSPGRIEPAARELIDKARAAGWQTLTLTVPHGDKPTEVVIHFDGSGRYAYDRTLPLGLREQVVCDGKTLL